MAKLELPGKRVLTRVDFNVPVCVMCEIPSNVMLADEFSDLFDGFSIGSNALTQLTLGVDRDSELLAHLFDERDPAAGIDSMSLNPDALLRVAQALEPRSTP